MSGGHVTRGADRDLGRNRKAARLDVDQELPPALGALAQADLEADEFLLALGRGPEDDKHALGLRLHPGLQVNAIYYPAGACKACCREGAQM